MAEENKVTAEEENVDALAQVKFYNEDEYSQIELEEMAKLYNESFKDIAEGEIITGKIVGINEDNVILDVGFKSDGSIPRTEFNPEDVLEVGMDIDIVIESVEDTDGNVVLSKKRADFLRIWAQVMDAYENEKVVQGKILKRIKGGMVVDLMGIEAFLPGSQIDIRPVRDFDAYVGKTMDFKIVKVNVPTENVVVSHKILIEKSIAGTRQKILDSLEKGQILEGIVKAITDFGVFVDLGGVDGLIHITDLSWGRINHPSEVVKLDEKIKVVVTDFDVAKKRISLSLKQLQSHPWEDIDEKYPVGSKHEGTARNLTNFGVFVELEPGVDGLVHISDLSWTKKVRHPGEVVKKGETIEVVVLGIDTDQRKISLGHKQIQDNPWDGFEKAYAAGIDTTGKIVRIIEKGLIAELPLGVDGFIPSTQLSPNKIKNLSFCFPIDTEIDLKVIEFDKENKKIVLSALAALKEKSDEEITEFINNYKLEKVSVEDIRNADTGKFDSSDFNIYEKESSSMNSSDEKEEVSEETEKKEDTEKTEE